jgi:hypothetical protein
MQGTFNQFPWFDPFVTEFRWRRVKIHMPPDERAVTRYAGDVGREDGRVSVETKERAAASGEGDERRGERRRAGDGALPRRSELRRCARPGARGSARLVFALPSSTTSRHDGRGSASVGTK